MKLQLATALLAVLTGTAASAQQAADPQTAQIHRGSVKIWIGLGLVGASAVLLPITAAKAESGPEGLAMSTGLGLAAAGSCMIWWGAQERRRAVRPQTTFGVAVGRTTSVRIRRSW